MLPAALLASNSTFVRGSLDTVCCHVSASMSVGMVRELPPCIMLLLDRAVLECQCATCSA